MDPFGRTYWVYILASRKHGTLYVGVTSDLTSRVYQHRNGTVPGFTAKYSVHDLVYFEPFEIIDDAIRREKQLKRWRRDWKIRRIERSKPRRTLTHRRRPWRTPQHAFAPLLPWTRMLYRPVRVSVRLTRQSSAGRNPPTRNLGTTVQRHLA